jgi:hypothetical protein
MSAFGCCKTPGNGTSWKVVALRGRRFDPTPAGSRIGGPNLSPRAVPRSRSSVRHDDLDGHAGVRYPHGIRLGGGRMRIKVFALVISLLLPQAVQAWETRMGFGASWPGIGESGSHRNGQHALVGVQNRLGGSSMYFRGELMANRYSPQSYVMKSHPREVIPTADTWIKTVDEQALMVGPALVLQGRPDGNWSPYAVGGISYFVNFIHADIRPASQYSSAGTTTEFSLNYGAGLQAKFASATAFFEIRQHTRELGGRPLQLTLGVGF